MKYALFIIAILFATSCSTNKVSTVNIENRNPYPISITLKALNCQQTFSAIASGEKKQEKFDWTSIEKKEGQYVILVMNEQTKGVDSFSHGFYKNGELCGFVDLISEGSQLKIQLSE
jgi:uncharacterized protein YxeA